MGIKNKNIFDVIRRNNPYFEDFITRSIYNSNAIEGNTLSFADTYAIVFNDNSVVVSAQPRDLYEAINLKYAFNYVLSNLDKALSLEFIKSVGVIINKNIQDIDDFRNSQVFIRGAVHIPPAPCYVRSMIAELVYKQGKIRDESVFDYLARFHIQFERIHPFTDGNGRTGRLLITKELLSRGYAPLVVPKERKLEYMNFLANCDNLGLSRFFEELNNYEIERMRNFGIALK